MGTTDDSLTAGGGQYCWVVAIEGFEYLLTDGPLSAVATAWAATTWTEALPGLSVDGEFEQSIKPWSADLTPGELRLRVVPDANDTLGIALHKGGAGNETYLEASFDANDTTFDVTDSTIFTIPGDVYVGLERIDTASDAANTITVDNRGIYAPFNVDGASTHRWGRVHALSAVDYGVSRKSIVSDQPRAWIGKWVGLWLHRVADGVVDTKAQAELVFAGKLEGYTDSSDGSTLLECVDARETLKTTTLLDDQFMAQVAEGITIDEDATFKASALATISGSTNTYAATDLTLSAGTHSLDELMSEVNDWLAADATISAVGDWHMGLISIEGEQRVRLSLEPVAAVSLATIELEMGNGFWQFLGWDSMAEGGENDKRSGYSATPSITFPNEPFTTLAWINTKWQNVSLVLDDTGARGTWVNNRDWLPTRIKNLTTSGENWGLIQIDDTMLCLAKYTDGATFTHVNELKILFTSQFTEPFTQLGVKLSESRQLIAKQVVMLEGSFQDIVSRFFAGTGADGYNHATYDDGDWGAQLGAAIPWEILGDNFDRTLQSLSDSSHLQGMTVTLERPTLLWDVIKSDLILRAAWLIWRGGTFEFVSPQTPSSATAVHTLTEANKASAEPGDTQRTPVQTTSKYLRNILKLSWERDIMSGEDKYRRTATVVYRASIDDYGEAKPITIKARNAAGDVAASLAADLITMVMPLYGQPLRVMQRSIALPLYTGMAPGDVVEVSDNYARDPSDGTRGLTLKPGIVMRHSCSYGGSGADMVGEVDVLFQDIDRAAVYSPSALVASYAASVFTVEAHEYSESAADADASHFATDDKVQVIEVDPDDPAAPQIHTTTVSSVSGNLITVADAFAAYDSAKTYRIVSDDYSTAAATQRTDCYLADGADGQILDLALPRRYGSHTYGISWTGPAAGDLAERPSDIMSDEGSPVSTAYAFAAARNANNLVGYSTATQMPMMFSSAQSVSEVPPDWEMMRCYPLYIGPGYPGDSQLVRKLTIAPLMKASTANTVSVRVTISENPPIDTGESILNVGFQGRYKQITFTSTSTTYETPTPQTVEAVANPQTGVGWVTIEGQEHASAGLDCWGLSEFWLGPLESA